MLKDEEKVLQEVTTTTQDGGEGIQELQEPTPQPDLRSYYKFIGGRTKPTKFEIPLLFELEKEKGRT